jgi:hypothetical protein
MSNTIEPLPTPTVADVQRCSADELLALPTPATDYLETHARLHSAAANALAEADAPKAAALRLLAQICSMMLVPDDRAAPFQPMIVTPVGRSMIPEDLTAEHINLLADLTPTVQHALLRARVADLVWHKARRKGIDFAHMAIDAYRRPPIDCEALDHDVLKYRQRAIQLALSTGKGGAAVASEIECELLGAFWLAVDTDDLSAALRYLRTLQAEGLATDQSGQIAASLEAIARRQLGDGDPFGSLQFADCAQYWSARAKDDERRAAMHVLAAESWVAQGDADGSGLSRGHCYARAIDEYQRVTARYREQHGATAAIAQLRGKLLAAGLAMLARMNTASHSFDISDLVGEAVGRVQGLPPDKALFAFCQIAPWPSLQALREEASIPLSGIAAIFTTTSVDDDGRVIAHEDGVGDADSRERRLQAEMVKACARRADIAARALVNPALDVIRQQCHLTPHDFFQITKLSALVPRDRADLVAKGLYAGYCRDFVQAIHILIPQFEHMVRITLKEAGALTTSRQDGIEQELGLSSLIELREMNDCFGDALTFTIRSLMCKPIGPNLRNQVAHGLAGTALCHSGYGVYAWWLILALVTEGYHIMMRAYEASNPADPTEA